jgi:hypothetical protein
MIRTAATAGMALSLRRERDMHAALGIIEGFYGTPWPWQARLETIACLAPHGYRFYYYAPKGDSFLRERWHEDHPRELADRLRHLAQSCHGLGVRFGIGLSPFEIYRNFDRTARAALARKVSFFTDIGVESLAILFDDMKGDTPALAETQAEIAHWIVERSTAEHFVVCPTYYTDDAVLDRHFGARPERYLEELGTRLDPTIDIFWTGEEICAREFTRGHLDRVTRLIGRKPFIWDNYPVNDGTRMSQFLHLRGFTGRPGAMAGRIAAHAVNPALQPVLTRIPALTLAESYDRGDAYEYMQAFRRAAEAVAGPELARLLVADVSLLQDTGLDRLGTAAEKLRARYRNFDHPVAREILAWLDGAYRFEAQLAES